VNIGAILQGPRLLRVDIAIRPSLRYLTAAVGYGITAFVIWWSLSARGLAPDLAIWDRVGDQVRAGVSPYSTAYPWSGLFFYAPPWALGFGLTSWLPGVAQAGLLFALELVCLRYVAGSWLRVGYLGLCPITGGELANGSFNLVVAAGIAAAMRGDGRLAALTALAKVSPILAVRDWRRAVVVLAVVAAVTVPVIGWWGDWVSMLVYSNEHYSIGYPVPWIPRLAAGIGLLAVFRWSSRARGFAAVIAIPAIYSYSVVLLYPLLTLRKR
jgi:hypothetical protein